MLKIKERRRQPHPVTKSSSLSPRGDRQNVFGSPTVIKVGEVSLEAIVRELTGEVIRDTMYRVMFLELRMVYTLLCFFFCFSV